jgi:4-amino-4-deoxy-L-arabinose transferase-like glycosyltransferase
VAIALPLFALLGLNWSNQDSPWKRMHWGRGWLVVLAISAPWFIAQAGTDTNVWKYFLGREMVDRVVSNVHGRDEPWWFFLAVLAGAVLFWLPWLASNAAVKSELTLAQRRLVRLSLGWAGLGLILFSLSRSKLATYMLPLCPPLALLTLAVVQNLGCPSVNPKRAKLARGAGFASVSMIAVLGITTRPSAATTSTTMPTASTRWASSGWYGGLFS